MAAYPATYFEAGIRLSAQAKMRNEELMDLQARRRRGMCTPEFCFAKHFDNTRLVKAPDPARARHMRWFLVAVTVLFSLVMVYGLQHFYAIEGGYRVELEKQVRDQMREENRQLRLAEAQLTQPGRIDSLARQLGLSEPQPGQVVHPTFRPDAAAPAFAQATPPAPAAQ